jgi:2-haloacid dehalogenase
MARRPRAVAFDVIETLFSLEPVRERLVGLGAPAHALELWFARMLRDAFAVTAAGGYVPFRALASATLHGLQGAAREGDVESVLAATGELDPHPDAEAALRRLHDAGVGVYTLTNGGAENTEKLLAGAELDRYVDHVISVEDVRVWKPAPLPYRHAAEVAGVATAELALVAVHSWDVHGAKRAGLTTGWASRLERTVPAIFDAPDVAGSDLVAVADGLLALDGG